MARPRRVALAALNIAMHAPHSAEGYVHLLQKAFRLHRIVRLGKLHGIMLGLIHRPKHHGDVLMLTGEIYRFVQLDPSEQWFNSQTREPATDDDVGQINIPSHLLPHLQIIPFAFNAKTHHLWYVKADKQNTLSPSTATKFMTILLNEVVHKEELPEVSVTPIPESTSVDAVLGLPGLEYLKIELVRPNPDAADSAEARWLRKLERQKTTKAKLELHRQRNSHIEPDAETRDMAIAASRNGLVYGRGRTADGLPVEDSTVNRPMVQHVLVDTDIETVGRVLERAATD